MRKRARNFTVMRDIVNRTPAVIALCAAFLLASCGGDDSPTGPTQGIDSPTGPTQGIDGARIQVTDVSVGAAAIGHCLNGTIQNTGSVTLDRHLYLTAVFHNDVGRLHSVDSVVDHPFASGEQRHIDILVDGARVEGWTHFIFQLTLDLPGSNQVVSCTGCDSRTASVRQASCYE